LKRPTRSAALVALAAFLVAVVVHNKRNGSTSTAHVSTKNEAIPAKTVTNRAVNSSSFRINEHMEDMGDWATPYWEPFKIALGTLYALCLAQSFATTVTYIRHSHAAFDSHRIESVVTNHAVVAVADLAAYVIWISLFFLYNTRLYMLVPTNPGRTRVTAYAGLTLAFGAFFFFATSLGAASRTQCLAISLVIFSDIIFPLHLGVVTHAKARIWWLARDLCQFALAFSVFLLTSNAVMRNPIWIYLLLAALILQLFIAPLEFRYQIREDSVGHAR
jgi:hypothetical protein